MHEDDELVARFAELSARKLAAFCAQEGLTYANEQRHLAKQCKLAALEIAAACDPSPALEPFGFGPKLGWAGLGHVDLVFRWPDREPTFVELKCSSDLSACVWDAVKLATALRHGNCSSAYLLAGASLAAWTKPARGTELFTGGRWRTNGPEIFDAYRDWWTTWEKEGHIPGSVSEEIETVSLGAFPLTIGMAPWMLRLARVEAHGISTNWSGASSPAEHDSR